MVNNSTPDEVDASGLEFVRLTCDGPVPGVDYVMQRPKQRQDDELAKENLAVPSSVVTGESLFPLSFSFSFHFADMSRTQ